MKRIIKSVLILILIIFAIVIASRFYNFSYTVNTWDGWCSQLLGEDLYDKYNTFSISFDHEAIRDDFVKRYDELVIQNIAYRYLGGASSDDPTVKEIKRLKMIGVWSEGNDLYLRNDLLIIDEELGIDDFVEWEKKFRKSIEAAQKYEDMEDIPYCIFGTMNTHFAKFILIGPNKKSVSIPLDFTFKKSFKKKDGSKDEKWVQSIETSPTWEFFPCTDYLITAICKITKNFSDPGSLPPTVSVGDIIKFKDREGKSQQFDVRAINFFVFDKDVDFTYGGERYTARKGETICNIYDSTKALISEDDVSKIVIEGCHLIR